MTRTFIQTLEFSRNWDNLGFDDDDLRLLEIDIMEHPDKYPVMKGTGGLRKARIALDDNNKGKSGGARSRKSLKHLRRALEVNNMSNSVYESIMTGLNEALEDAKSAKKVLKRHKVTVEPVKVYEADEVKKIRNSTGMSQKIFASYMGVSDKTVEAWEAGTNHPSGAASRLLSMIEKDKELIIKFPFVTNAMAK